MVGWVMQGQGESYWGGLGWVMQRWGVVAGMGWVGHTVVRWVMQGWVGGWSYMGCSGVCKISLNNLICHKLGILFFLLTNYFTNQAPHSTPA